MDTELSRIAVTAASACWELSVLGLAEADEAETLRLYNDDDEGFLRREGLEYKVESFVWFKKQDNEETSGLKSWERKETEPSVAVDTGIVGKRW